MVSTMLPVTKSVVVNMHWGVNLLAKFGKMMPYLMVNKIGFERVKEVKVVEEKMAESNVGDLELLKGMCFLDERGFGGLGEGENKEMKQREMKQRLEDEVRSF
ncbi:hypothetical protein DVH24_015658 [Malus domestica]|uniref:Uncharacterized protein n=1 Tax=Malus domestica TaxID=3750 RepID=A0A498HHT4_MALDO|nr:hypothetical protein DVH24_015658 [Malus domestica]